MVSSLSANDSTRSHSEKIDKEFHMKHATHTHQWWLPQIYFRMPVFLSAARMRIHTNKSFVRLDTQLFRFPFSTFFTVYTHAHSLACMFLSRSAMVWAFVFFSLFRRCDSSVYKWLFTRTNLYLISFIKMNSERIKKTQLKWSEKNISDFHVTVSKWAKFPFQTERSALQQSSVCSWHVPYRT